MTTLKTLALTLVAGTAVAATPAPLNWNVDASHTEVTFEVRHFFTPVTGKFDDFAVDLFFDPASPETARVSATIQVASVDTNNERRDGHLRTPDFFDAETFPTITFTSTSVRRGEGENEFVATGDLTIKDVTKTIELPIRLLGVADVPAEMQEAIGSAQVASFEADLLIDRRDFDVGTGSWAETAIVGKDVEIKIVLEAGR